MHEQLISDFRKALAGTPKSYRVVTAHKVAETTEPKPSENLKTSQFIEDSMEKDYVPEEDYDVELGLANREIKELGI